MYDVSLLTQLFSSIDVPYFRFDGLGLSNTERPNSLSFVDDTRYVDQVNANRNIVAVLVTERIESQLDPRILCIRRDAPRNDFFVLHNYLFKLRYVRHPSVIATSAIISDTAFVSPHNVVIEENVVVEPHVTIHSDVHIHQNVIIRSGSVIGSEGFEMKRSAHGILSVCHDGRVILERKVEIGSNCTIDKGVYGKDTVIGEGTKLDNQVHIAHNVTIGRNCLLVASCCVLGSVTVGDDVWIGPKVMIINGCKIGSRAELTLGSIVTKDVAHDTKIVGKIALSKLMTYE